jgi:SAM-dependent methyltransferase
MTATPKKAYDPVAYWDARYSTIDLTRSGHIDLPARYNEWLYRRKKERLMQGLAAAGFQPRGASVLDIAAGTGVYVDMWRAAGVQRLVGIDISSAATQALKQRFPGWAFHVRDLAQPRLADATGRGFDLVTAIDMLYHVVGDADFPVALANIADVVAPGGLLAIHDTFMQHGERDFGYIRLRTLAGYTEALDAAGFDILSRTPTFFSMVQCHDLPLGWRTRLDDWTWHHVTNRFVQRLPGAAGRVLYHVDRALGAVRREGPSYEMMVCRRRIS